MLPAIVAHQGGWDELLLVVAPIALIGALLYGANRRARAELARRHSADSAESVESATDSNDDTRP